MDGTFGASMVGWQRQRSKIISVPRCTHASLFDDLLRSIHVYPVGLWRYIAASMQLFSPMMETVTDNHAVSIEHNRL